MIKEKVKPMVTIIMATYNRAHFILESLVSVQRQSFTDFECLIIDDGSSDNTAEVIQRILETDPRFCYFERSENYKKGLPGCRNYGLDLASGNYIIFFDDDDLVHPQNLEICLKLVEKSKIDFVNYQKQVFYDKYPTLGQINSDTLTPAYFEAKDVSALITGKKAMASCTVMWDKCCFDEIRFNEELQYAEEWECYTRILLNGFSGISINKVLYFNRKHPKSNTGEFLKKDLIRVTSKINAAKLIIANLKVKGIFSEDLNRFFIRMGFNLNSDSLIKTSLKANNDKLSRRLFYQIAFYIYPILRPILRLKGRLQG